MHFVQPHQASMTQLRADHLIAGPTSRRVDLQSVPAANSHGRETPLRPHLAQGGQTMILASGHDVPAPPVHARQHTADVVRADGSNLVARAATRHVHDDALRRLSSPP